MLPMPRWRCLAALVVVTTATAAWSRDVRADGNPVSTEDGAAAEVLFQEARRLMDAGKYALACPKFAASQKLSPAVGTLLNLADCYQQNGQTASAWVRFVDAQAAARRANRPEREKVARDRAAALEPKLSRLNVSVAERETPGLEVKRDGFVLDPAMFGTAVPVDPGKHTVDAEAPGRKKWTMTVEAGATTVLVKIPALEEAGEPQNTIPIVPKPAVESSGSGQRTAGLIVLGVGVVGLGIGTVFALSARSQWADAQSNHCLGTVCDPDGVALAQGAQSAGNVATIVFIVGGLATAGGALLYFSAPSGKHAALRVVPSVSPRSAGLTMGASF